MHPQFLCIGAQKAGTTWLYQNLKSHPDVWLPPIKELHFFDDGTPKGIFRGYWSNIQRANQKEAWRNIVFLLKLSLLPKTMRSYGKLFPEIKEQISGEITPAYARLDEGIVRQLHRLMPEIKIIYILRNPIERSWSQLVMRSSRLGHSVEQINGWPDVEIRNFIIASRALENSDYEANLKRWRNFFGEEAVRAFFYEDLKKQPEEFLMEVFRFIGVDPSEKYITARARRRIHKGSYTKIPTRFQSILAELHLDQINDIHTYLGSCYTARWREVATMLAGTEANRRGQVSRLELPAPDRRFSRPLTSRLDR